MYYKDNDHSGQMLPTFLHFRSKHGRHVVGPKHVEVPVFTDFLDKICGTVPNSYPNPHSIR